MDIDGADPEWLTTLEDRIGQGAVPDTLSELATEMVAYFRRVAPLMMMRWSNPDSSACNPSSPHPALRRIRQLASYFEAEIALGRIRAQDPEVLARTFVGSLLNFVFLEVLAPLPQEHAMRSDAFVAGLVGLLWAGASPVPHPRVLGENPSPEL
jgi:AcrR family transcriptional regulator